MKLLQKIFLIGLITVSKFAGATDCNTNCSNACTTSLGFLDPVCKGRCEAERVLSCNTGLNSCTMWKVNASTTVGYHAAVKGIETSNRIYSTPIDVHSCHKAIDLAALGGGAASFAASAYEQGISAAISGAVDIGSIATGAAAKHFAHCACSDAKYKQRGTNSDGVAAAGNDLVYVSMYRLPGRWAVKHGPRDNWFQYFQDTKAFLEGDQDFSELSFFSSQTMNSATVICKETSLRSKGIGAEPLKTVFNMAKNSNFSRCKFRVENGLELYNKTWDQYYVALRKGNQWRVSWGAYENSTSIYQSALNLIGGSFDEMNAGSYSSEFVNKVHMACDISSSTSNGLSTSDSIVTDRYDRGSAALKPLVDRAAANGYKACTFKLETMDF